MRLIIENWSRCEADDRDCYLYRVVVVLMIEDWSYCEAEDRDHWLCRAAVRQKIGVVVILIIVIIVFAKSLWC